MSSLSNSMNTLKRSYKALCLIEISIKKELNRFGKTPDLEVVDWLYDVEIFKSQVKQIERSNAYKISQSCCFDFFIYSRLFKDTCIQVAKLLNQSNSFVNGLFIKSISIPELCPNSSRLLDTIWENLMDPNVVIPSIYGGLGVGKTTAMMKIKKKLATTSHSFHSIFWVTFSQVTGLYQLQTDIARQMVLDLPEVDRARILLEGLQKLDNFLIIIDDLWDPIPPIPLIEVGIPQPNRENGSKIVLIAHEIRVCLIMDSNKIIKVSSLSPTDKWDLFIGKIGNIVTTPNVEPVARQIVELCGNQPFFITAIGHALKDQVDIGVWNTTLALLRTAATHRKDMVLLKACYNLLKHEMVQKCFLYCALFPEDYHFDSEQLIRYWIAESLIDADADMVTKIDKGFKIIRKLLDAKMLEISVNKDEDEYLKLPRMWRNWAIYVMKEEPEFSFSSLCNSVNVKKAYEVHQLQETRLFANEMFSRKCGKQYPRRSKLLGTILEILMLE